MIKDNKKAIILENLYVKIEISKKDAAVLAITDKTSGESVMGETVPFFRLYSLNGENDGKPMDYINGIDEGGEKKNPDDLM